MHRKEVSLQSPLRILQRSIRGGLGAGNLAAVLAPPGVGKSAFLVQVGLDELLRGGLVLHIALGQTVERVSAWYRALFADLAESVDLADRAGVAETIGHRLLIRAYADGSHAPNRVDEALAPFDSHLVFRPSVILVDGLDWSGPGCPEALAAMKARARRAGAELWTTAQTRGDQGALALPPPCDPCAALVDVGLLLEPRETCVAVRLVKDFDNPSPADVRLALHCETLRLVKDGAAEWEGEPPPGAFTLLASGSAGAEAEFGACAERWGLREVNFTFRGREELVRSRGLVELGEEELRLGSVSAAYVRAHMHRRYPDTPGFRHLLQAIWHQVSGAGELFSVGTILPDRTAHGGTGWAVELARHWNKPVHLFDQERGLWFAWKERDWIGVEPPAITRARFAGSGTRTLTDAGRAAIHGLFERSFGHRPPS